MKKFKGFTLIELLISMVIIGILAVVLSESYITISKMALQIEQEKNISEESLVLTQILQSISDEATIDYEKYRELGENLEDSNGFTDILYLTGGQRSGASIYVTGDCMDLEGNFQPNEEGQYPDSYGVIQQYSGCSLILNRDGIETDLLAKGKVIASKVKFRVIPYDADKYYFENGKSDSYIINNVHQPAFWIWIHLYSTLYQPTGTNKVDLPLQLFFNLNL